MNSQTFKKPTGHPIVNSSPRLDYLDATRAFALILGVVFHAGLSFVPIYIGWAVQDVSTSFLVGAFLTVSHSFRMEVFFLLAGFFSCLTLNRRGVGEFMRSRLIRIGIPFFLGWFILRPLITSGWIMGSASLSGDVDIWTGLIGGFKSLAALPSGIFVGTHLWFLYYLILITALVVVVRGILSTLGSGGGRFLRRSDTIVAWIVDSRMSHVILAVPTTAALLFMDSWGMDTPDKSLIPHLPVLAVYGGFFGFGWMLNRQSGLIDRLAQMTVLRWVAAAGGAATILLMSGFEHNPGAPFRHVTHVVHAFSYALTMWSLVFLTLGFFRRFCVCPSKFVRFVADSSYWMYLVHLPVVVWLQVAVAELPFHWSLKLVFISLVTIGVSLLTCDLFVRPTFIGRVLNGRQRESVILSWIRSLSQRIHNGIRAK